LGIVDAFQELDSERAAAMPCGTTALGPLLQVGEAPVGVLGQGGHHHPGAEQVPLTCVKGIWLPLPKTTVAVPALEFTTRCVP